MLGTVRTDLNFFFFRAGVIIRSRHRLHEANQISKRIPELSRFPYQDCLAHSGRQWKIPDAADDPGSLNSDATAGHHVRSTPRGLQNA